VYHYWPLAQDYTG